MLHGKNRIPYRIDRRLPSLAGPEYHAIISFGLPYEPEDSQYGKYRLSPVIANDASNKETEKDDRTDYSYRKILCTTHAVKRNDMFHHDRSSWCVHLRYGRW